MTAAPAQIRPETEQTVRDFVTAAILRLAERVSGQQIKWEARSRWTRSADGHFRKSIERAIPLSLSADDAWIHSVEGYDSSVAALEADPVVSRHLNRLVGCQQGALCLDANRVLRGMFYESIGREDTIAFDQDRFKREWLAFSEFLLAERIGFKTIAPIPGLQLPGFPFQLNDELVIDRLTDDEVTRCVSVNSLRPTFEGFPVIEAETAIGIRKFDYLPKTLGADPSSSLEPLSGSEGSFGRRPAFRYDLLCDDVLCALRIFKHGRIHCTGGASWTDAWLSMGITYHVRGQSALFSLYELTEAEAPRFLKLWGLLEKAELFLEFSIHRFNLAFGRELLADRIVDLVIAAESLFLADLDALDRGELRFRVSLRTAKFIKHPTYGAEDVFGLMRRAYDARSAVVHGGSPRNTSLPDDAKANLQAFVDAVEELVRLALRKALEMGPDATQMRRPEFWSSMLF